MSTLQNEYKNSEHKHDIRRSLNRAVSVRYHPESRCVVVLMSSGTTIRFHARLAEKLANSKPEILANVEITSSGLGLYWPDLNVNVSIPGIMTGRGVFSEEQWNLLKFNQMHEKHRHGRFGLKRADLAP